LPPLRVGVVSFLNTLPLIDGLEDLRDLELCPFVPSHLIDELLSGHVDVALCSSIDLQRVTQPLFVLPVGLLGCDGPTMTVRLFSRRPIEEIRAVHCDTDSHTSVALMQIILRERYGVAPELIDYDARKQLVRDRPGEWPETVLLIGDKVVTDPPPDAPYPHQLDLGGAWVEHTSMPFVFALWLARPEAGVERLGTVSTVLDRQRRYNRRLIETIVHRHAAQRGWTVSAAYRYLTDNITFEFTEERLRGLELFYDKAHEHGLIPRRRPVDLLPSDARVCSPAHAARV